VADPIILVVDTETTGMAPPAEVCEVGWCPLTKKSEEWEVGLPESRLFGVDAMPPEVRAIHHITAADVAGQPKFMPSGFVESFDFCALFAAHNAAFEDQWLMLDGVMPLLCTYKAALRVWPQAPSHSNGALRYWLEDQGKLALDHDTAMPPHRAGPDAYVTAHILKALLNEATANQMVRWTREPRLLPTCPLGKFRGKPWPEVEAGFLSWMLKQADMDPDLKWNAQHELDRRSGADEVV